MQIYKTSRELEGRQLERMDQLVFGEYTYAVCSNYLTNREGPNQKIFEAISVEKNIFCTKAYGYEADTGDCPECHEGDYAALTRLAIAIFRRLEGISEPTYSSELTSLMSNVLEFFRNLTASPDDLLLKELGIENPTNVPTDLGLKLSQEITYAANRDSIIDIAKQMKADADKV